MLVKGVYLFAVERTVQNLLPEGDYGLYFSLLGLGMLLQVVADAGLQLYVGRTLGGHRQLAPKYLPHFLGLKVLLSGIFYLLLLAAGWGLGYRGAALGLLALTGAGQALASLVAFLRAGVAGLGRYTLDSWFSILDKSIMVALVGGLLLLAPERLTIFLFAGTQVLSWLVCVVVVGRGLWGGGGGWRPRFRPITMGMLLRGGAPFAVAVFLQTAYTRTDAVMIERLLADGAVAAGHYAAGYRLLDAMNIFGYLLAGLLLPMYARAQAEGGHRLARLLRESSGLMLSVGITAGVAVAAYADPIVDTLYDFAEPRTATILFFLSLTFTAQCLHYCYGALLSGTGLIGRLNWVFGVAIVFNVGGNLWALPRYGAAGAAAVTLATQAAVGLAQVGLAHRWLNIPVAGTGYGRLLVVTVMVFTTTAALTYVDWPWWIEVAGVGAAGAGTYLVLEGVPYILVRDK